MIASPLAKPLARSLARPLTLSEEYDPDAVAYFDRADVTDPNAKRAISDLIRGLKSLDQWSFTSALWSGRSSQSAGTGTIVPDIKGLHDLTLVNSPTWSSDGIQNSPNGYATTTGLTVGPNSTVLLVAMADSGNQNTFGGTLSDLNAKGIRIKQERFHYGDGELQAAFFDMSATGYFQMIGGSFGTNLIGFKDATAVDLGAISPVQPPSNSLALLAAVDGGAQQFFIGKLAFGIVLSHAITDASAIFNLLSATVCKGLDLGFDPDARSYFKRVFAESGTDIPYSEKRNIHDFIVGLKSMGAWSSLLDGGTFRASQNAGTGTTTLSLKGTNDGTMVNGPTWGTDGLSLTIPGQYVSCANPFLGETVTSAKLCWFGSFNNQAGRAAQMFSSGNTDYSHRFTMDAYFSGPQLRARIATETTNQGIDFFQSAAQLRSLKYASWELSTQTLYLRYLREGDTSIQSVPSTSIIGTFTPTIGELYLGDNTTYSGQLFDGTYGAWFIFNAPVDDQSLVELYKSTIGKGIPMP